MITEEICTYEVCKLAKEKGFPQDVFGTCEMKSSCYVDDGKFYKDGCICPVEDAYTAPTQSLLQRWIREKKNIDIAIVPVYAVGYSYIVYNINCRDNRVVNTSADYATYELALEDALKYALANLV